MTIRSTVAIPTAAALVAAAGLLVAASPAHARQENAPAAKPAATAKAPGVTVTKWAGGLSGPQGVAFDGKFVYVTENGSGRVLRFDARGAGKTIYAEGLQGPAFALLHGGALYVAERKGNSVARIGSDAKVTRLTGEVVDPLGLAPTADGALFALSHRESIVHRFTLAGGGTRAGQPFASPTGGAKYGWRDLAVGKDGAAYVTDELSNAVLVRKPGADAAFVPFATGLSSPSGLVFGPDGALYVTEEGTGRVSRVSADGKTVTVLAEGMGKARDAAFLDARTLLVTDRDGGTVWKITLPAP